MTVAEAIQKSKDLQLRHSVLNELKHMCKLSQTCMDIHSDILSQIMQETDDKIDEIESAFKFIEFTVDERLKYGEWNPAG